MRIALARAAAERIELERQHGRGKPPVSAELKDHRVVGVGSRVYWAKGWKTFTDFLMAYYKRAFTETWWMDQVVRSAEQRHPLFQWYAMTCEFRNSVPRDPGEIVTASPTGAMKGVLWLAYGLYLLEHNIEIQQRLLQRLRSHDPVQIYGAVFEVWIAGIMIWAGFELRLEDETDGTRTHCEFTATSKRTGKSYSVEVKVCDPGNLRADGAADRAVRQQLARALRKRADHPRIIFIDLNVPWLPDGVTPQDWLEARVRAMRRQEGTLKEAPPAFVFLTNYPYRYDLDGTSAFRVGVLEGFKIPMLKHDVVHPSLRSAGDLREEYADLFHLAEAVIEIKIPSTFDGQPASRAFSNQKEGRLLVGDRYELPGPNGEVAVGELTQGLVIPETKESTCIFKLKDGRQVIGRSLLSDEEVAAHLESPETFFGVPQDVSKKLETPLELYEWMLKVYRKTPRERLLEFLRGRPDFEQMQDLPQDELAKIFCEGIALGAEVRRRAAGD